MDKTTRAVMIIIAAVIALTAVLLAFFLTSTRIQNQEEYAPINQDQKITLVSGNMEYVKSMKITNQYGTYTVVPVSNGHMGDGTLYTLEGIDITMIEAQTVYNIVKYGFNPIVAEHLGEVENRKAYGLDMPLAEVTVAFRDGEIYEYQVGNAVGKKRGRYYMCAKGSSNVYIITAEPDMLGKVESLVNKTIFSIARDEAGSEQENGIDTMTIMNPNLPQGIKFEQVGEDRTYRIPSYPAIKLSQEVLEVIKSNFFKLQAEAVAAIQANEEQLERYGLNAPNTDITFEVNGQLYQLLVGNEENGLRYVKRADTDIIYQVASEKIAVFIKGTLFTLTDSSVYAVNETYFSSVKIIGGDKNAVITMVQAEAENDAYHFMLNGAPMGKKDYNIWLKALKNIRVQADTALQAEGEPLLSIVLKPLGTNRTDTLSFYRLGNDVLVTVNGIVRGTVTVKTFDLFRAAMPL